MPNLTHLAHSLQLLLNEQVSSLARSCGLVVRDSKLNAPLLVLILLTGYYQLPTASYNVLAQVAFDLGLNITRQGLQQRCAQKVMVEFLQALLKAACARLQNQLPTRAEWLQRFEAIILHDSTTIGLADGLHQEFASTSAKAGRGSRAGLKVQLSFDWLNFQLARLSHHSANQSDLGYHLKSEWYKPNTLVLFDLGYFVLSSLAEFNRRGIWWLSRLDLKCNLYDPTDQHLLKLENEFASQLLRDGYVDQPVLVGDKAHLPARLVMIAVPSAIANTRRGRANEQGRKRGYRPDADQREWLAYNAYLTNLACPEFSCEQLCLLYRVRWQIELLFKLAKSQAALDEARGRTKSGVLVPLYAKLLGLAIFGYLALKVEAAPNHCTPGPAQPPCEGQGQLDPADYFELSWPKAWQTLSRRALHFGQAVVAGEAALGEFMADIHTRFRRWAGKTHQPSRLTTSQQLVGQQLHFQTRRQALAKAGLG